MTKGKAYTEEERSKMIELANRGMTAREISTTLENQFSKDAILRFLKREGVGVKQGEKGRVSTVPQESVNEICELYRKGYSTKDLGLKFNVSSVTVIKILKANNIDRRQCDELFAFFSREQEEAVINLYITGTPTQSIADMYGCSKVTIERMFRKRGVEMVRGRIGRLHEEGLSPYYWSELRKKGVSLADSYYSGKSVQELADHYKTSRDLMEDILKENGVEIRHPKQINFNERAFDDLSDECAAYWLGFIYADGNNSKEYTIRINLQLRDMAHLEKFRQWIGFDRPLKEKIGEHPQCGINLTSKYMSTRLSELGVQVGRGEMYKTLTHMPESSYPHFIRGLFDGDGYMKKGRRAIVLSAGEQDTIKTIALTLSKKTGCKVSQVKQVSAGGYKGYWFGSCCDLIVDYIYRNPRVWLERKRDIVDNWPSPWPRERNDLGKWR